MPAQKEQSIHIANMFSRYRAVHFPTQWLIVGCLANIVFFTHDEELSDVQKEEATTPDKYGKTALMFASIYAEPETIEVLLKHGADIKIRDNERKSAFEYAISNGKLYGTEAYNKMKELIAQ